MSDPIDHQTTDLAVVHETKKVLGGNFQSTGRLGSSEDVKPP